LLDASVGYDDTVLARDITLTLRRGEALGIIGPNGSGKSTLVKTVLGKLPQLAGEIQWGSGVEVGYYAQQLDDLDPRNEIIMELRRVASSQATAGELRSFLAQFLFTGNDVYKKVQDLSGGEKGRLALAKLIYSKVNVLVLDEPTNHLDIPSRESLEEALDAYDGTIITISHDRYFLDRVATQILALDGRGGAEHFDGDYTEYHDWKAEGKSTATADVDPRADTAEESRGKHVATANSAATSETPKPSSNKQGSAPEKPKAQKSGGGKKKNTRDAAAIEAEIAELEKRLASISNELSLPATARDPKRLQT
jgi:ATP-binding cassette subfamily F protein 3